MIGYRKKTDKFAQGKVLLRIKSQCIVDKRLISVQATCVRQTSSVQYMRIYNSSTQVKLFSHPWQHKTLANIRPEAFFWYIS